MRFPAYVKYIFLSILFLLASFNLFRTTRSIVHRSERFDELQVEVNSLNTEKLSLEDELGYKRSDAFVEMEARNKLNMVKPGEHLYITENVLSARTDSTQENETINTSSGNNVRLWVNLLF